MRIIVTWMLGLGLLANGSVMLFDPAGWYAAVPGVVETGPFNPHFVRDIGVAHFICGTGLVWFAISSAARPAAALGAAFLALHALVHLWDAAAGREHAHQLLVDLPTVFLPPALAIWVVWPPSRRVRSSAKDKQQTAGGNI